ncbi:CAAX prenyl protease-related protein [Rugamonas sp. CCM 8940]|uniref:CAAX prenyl protease-related protein n=1 Tax=Rugamonas sp. CCM 8940 TaxID=2765359 RepID=UPI0018F6D708|nr:CAAX prenyl protease-related protein [Rugamonas sp. CCM 8940]MBJ7308718.1 CAAX prenyl protease-related protein [Rugamonas sp. CCM 8940]
MFERATLARVLPFAIYMAFIAIADLLGRLGWSGAELRWLYPIKIAAVLAALVYYRRSYVELLPARPDWRAVAAAVAAGLLVFLLWINLDAPWMALGGSAGFDPRTDGQIDWTLVALRLLGAAVVVPVMEELFWRSFLMRWIERADFLNVNPAHVRFKAFIVTVILFGFEHSLWLAGIVAGAAYSVLYMRSRSLWTAVLAHAVTNGVLGVWIIFTAHWTYW